MPYSVKKVAGGYKVKKDADGKALSKKPLANATAHKQKKAVEISESRKQKPQTKQDRLDEAEGKKKGKKKKKVQNVTDRLHEAEGKKKAIKETRKLKKK